ncbi:MAG: FAD-dependent oxidoreductase [bacterium]|nr:FAD-dependent oxidoreductase [bacterium]
MKTDPVCKMEIREDEAVTTDYDGEMFFFCSEGCRDVFLEGKSARKPRTIYDLIIIGGGPAGLTAAVYASTLRLNTFLIAVDLGGQAIDSTKIKNYMGFDFITGPELVGKFKYQMIHSNYIDHLMSEVEKIEPVEDGFRVTTPKRKNFFAKALIVATGMTRRRLNVPGEEKLQRRGVFYGNIQDYSFVQGEDAAVIGGGNSALQMVEKLQDEERRIYLVSDRKLTADPSDVERIRGFENVKIFEEYKVEALTGEGSLSGIRIRKKGGETTQSFAVKGAFVAVGLHPNTYVVSKLVELNERMEITINPDCSTSSPGIFAAGDVTNAFGKRIIIASGEGAKAAIAAREYLLNLGKRGL